MNLIVLSLIVLTLIVCLIRFGWFLITEKFICSFNRKLFPKRKYFWHFRGSQTWGSSSFRQLSPNPHIDQAFLLNRNPLNQLLQLHYQMINLKGKTALITGGSAGLGAAVAHQLAAEGVNIAINYANSEQRAQLLVDELKSTYNVQSIAIKGDVFDIDNIHKLVDETVEKLGGLDIIISNAGWTKMVPFENIDELDESLWDGTFTANVKAHFFLFKAAKPIFDQNEEGGVFIASASVAGRMVYGSSIPYAVSKAALIHLVKLLAKSQGPKCRVHAVCPGLLLTEWGKRFPEEKINMTKEMSPIKEITDVDECAAQFVTLCKLKTSTGSIIAMDAGISV